MAAAPVAQHGEDVLLAQLRDSGFDPCMTTVGRVALALGAARTQLHVYAPFWLSATPSGAVRTLLERDGWLNVFGLPLEALEAVRLWIDNSGELAPPSSPLSMERLLCLFYYLRHGSARSLCAALWGVSPLTHQKHTDQTLECLEQVFVKVSALAMLIDI